jgi:transcription-repair coupling factor (superfamily II helicase)
MPKGIGYEKGYLDPKGHRIPDNYKQVSRLRDKANWEEGKAKMRRMVVRTATKALGGMAKRQEARGASKAIKKAATTTFGGRR